LVVVLEVEVRELLAAMALAEVALADIGLGRLKPLVLERL
jgi:hypothetical protein